MALPITTQPKAEIGPKDYPLPNDWNVGLFNCCDDMKICCLTTFCGLCYGCMMASKLDENPMIVCCVPQWLIPVRVKTRMMYGINGNICTDCLAVNFCGPCVMCQVANQLKYNIVVNA
ncbi:cornifelin homolog A-like [Convolutriloba macropyga]|uniref:cornifelin homolog A-like n=1 Tax=Convolutriloba macropyga TaxID=536237 RepID=UPI003F51D43F